MKIRVLAVPYDSGRREERMGRGPGHILRHGLERALKMRGHELHVEHVEAPANHLSPPGGLTLA